MRAASRTSGLNLQFAPPEQPSTALHPSDLPNGPDRRPGWCDAMRREHHRRYQRRFTRLASLARSLTSPASAGLLLAGAAWLALFGALALPATAQADVLVSNTGQEKMVTSGLRDNLGRAQTFTVGADDGNYTLSSIEAEITNGRVSSADMDLLTVAIWSTHASGENAGHPDSPLYTLTKPASIASGESLVRFDAPPNSVLGAGKTYAVVIIYNKSFDNNFNAPAWRMVNTTAEDANPAPGWSIGNTIHTSAAGSTSWRPSSSQYHKAFAIRVNGTAGGGEPVWFATMTAGETRVGHGYDATDTPAVGALDDDDDFDYGPTPETTLFYTVRAIDVANVVRFVVQPSLPTEEALTLEFGGHVLAFSDRILAISIGGSSVWLVPAALDDLAAEFPVGSTATVCLRTDMQVCPLGRIVASELRVADDVSAEEGENLTFTVELSPASEVFAETVTVDWATSGGTATSGTDFTAGSGTLTFAPGVTEQTFTVATIEDMTDEDHETFTVTLSNATSATISGATATGTIENDDWPPLAWSTTLTVGNDFLAAEHYGYYASVGSLTDQSFRYRSATYIVEQVTVTTGREVFFNLHRSGLPTEDFMTLEIDGHEFPFGDRKSESTDKTWVWDAPADLHDPATNFPVGSTATVCLRTEGQVCPTDGNVAPTFSSSATFSAAENQTMAGTVEASDGDAGDDITGYAITGGADQSFFSIGATSGALTFNSAPNYEAPSDTDTNGSYVVTVEATSGAGERENTATQTITVTVTDVGGEAPGKPAAPDVSAASATSLSVRWSAPSNAGPAITDFDHRHRTASPEGNWTEVTGTASTALSATITGLADGTSYDVQVRATNDEGTGAWSDSGTESTDANAAPSFDSSATFSAAENQTVAGTVRASDSDTGDDITGYAITGGADQGFFSIGATSGALTFDAAPNYEDAKDIVSVDPANAAGNNQYVVVVTATSGAGEREKTATQTITVTVTDAGGEAPGKPAAPNVSAASATSLSVSWSAPANAGPAITDYDHRHRTTSPEGSWTAVADTTSTALSATITGLADGTSYDVQVRATNDEGTGDWSDSGTESTDANAAPSFDSSATFSAAENQTTAGTVEASDSDTGDDITDYAITGGADRDLFSIGATDGTLTFNAAPNFEDAKDIESVDPANAAGNNQYVVVVTATSGAGEREKTATQTITVTVTDVGGEAPGKPDAPDVSAASATSLNVNWSAPDNAGPAITDYDYRHRTASPEGSWTAVTNTTITVTTATIAGLADGTSYDVQVRASNDEGTGEWSNSGTDSTDANAAPSFDSSAAFDAAENQTTAGTVEASDDDSGDDITGYAITGGADQTFFSIGATSGALTFKTAPNFEDAEDSDTNGSYVVEVRATSGMGEREKTATQTITVTVTDVGGEAPGKPAAPTVSAASATSLSVSWSAPDNAGPAISDYDHRHRTTSPEGDWTEVTGTTSTMLSATIAGLAEGTSYDVQVRATNDEGTGAWSDSGTESTDANAAPSFDSSATFDAAENQTTAGTVEASDDDSGDDVTGYAITGGADQGAFSIGATSGALTFDAAPNFEAPSDTDTNGSYVVEVRATSGMGEREKTATQTITVTVTDVNTEAPGKPAAPNVSAASATSLSVSWSAPANAGPAITDYDYRHRTASPEGAWTEVTGTTSTMLSATIAGLAEGTSYDVQVRATNDEGTGAWSDSGTESTDANAAPSFNSSATFDAAENQTTAGTVVASDGDAGDDVTGYAITGGADQGAFSIGATSGALTFDAAPNFEAPSDTDTNGSYVVEVRATSGMGEREKTATQTITVTVTDVNTEAPGKPAAPNVSAASATSLSVRWLAPDNAGPAITDYDRRHRTSPAGSWTEVTGTASTALSATITGLADGTAYDVQVRATNDEGTGAWSDSGTESTDANAAPSFDSSATFSAAENQTTAGTVEASDSDTGDDITDYAITGGADRDLFSIGATDGTLTFNAAPNFEDAKDIESVDPANAAGNNQYVVVVTATSGAGEREKTATQTITVTVTDVGGEAPGKPDAPDVSAASATSLNVSWSAPDNAGPAITDYDYRHRTASPEGSWTAVTNTTITVTTATIAGLADGTSYDVQVRASNDEGTGEWSNSGTDSTDANAAPSFDSSAAFDAAENQTTAGTVEASDDDSGDDITGYAITGGADQTFFSIGATSGALTFKTAPNFEDAEDSDTNGSYVVEVRATSGMGEREKTATQTITVTVTDVGGEAPGKPAAPTVSAASATSLSVSWSAPDNAGPAISDYDHRHRTTSPEGDWTEVTGTTSTMLSATIAGLAEGTSYDVQVRATNDEGTGAWSDSGTESTDANAAPSFDSSATFDAAENQTTAGTVEASDGDAGDDVTGYAITGGADQGAFSIGATSGALTFDAAPNFEAPSDTDTNGSYVVEVRATSGMGEREKTATQTITVTVTDVNTEAPGKPAAPNVSAASATSLSVRWTAPDNAGPAITDYDRRHRTSPAGSWTEVTGTASTALSATITGLADGTAYDVQVRATNDEGTGAWSDSGTESTDANAAPSFDSSATFSAAENQTTAGTVEASDSDTGDDITDYAITGGADQAFFSVGATSGELTFDAAPNYEDAKDIVSVDPANAAGNNQYVVVVTASSGAGEREKTATQTITVTVTDVSGEAPGKPAAPNVSSASATSLTVNWSAPSNAGPAITDYDVQYREGTGGGWTNGNYNGTATTATLTGLSENTSHQVQVRATNDDGTGDWSDSGTGSTDANAAPSFDSPAAFDAAENQRAAGTVVASDGDSEDKIERYDITGGADQALFMVIASSGDLEFRDAPNFEDAQDQGTNNQYVVTVQATSGTGTREKTATQTVTVTVTDVGGEAPGKPDAPNVSSASVTSLTVTWAAPDNAGPAITDYDVQYRAGTSGDWSDGNHAGDATMATLTGLSENTSYQVQVQATNGDGTGAWSDSGSGVTDANAAPAFTSSATFSAAENQTAVGEVRASDNDMEDDVTGYAIVGGADQTLFSIVSSLGVLSFDAAPNFEDPEDQATNNTYVVEVQATSGAGPRRKTATQTITVRVTDMSGEVPARPEAPNVSAASASSLDVNWTAPANAGPAITDYDYRYRTAASTGSWTEVTDTAITAPSTTIGSLEANTSYDVQVRAANVDGESDWSEEGRGGTTDGGTSTGTGTGSGSSGSGGSGGSGSGGSGGSGGGSGASGGGSGGGAANRPPVVEREIDDQALDVGEVLELDIRLNFYDRDQRALDYTVASADASVAAVEVDRNGVLTIRGVSRGVTAITVTVADRRDERASDTFAVTVRGPALVALVPRAADPVREGFVRVINHDAKAGEVSIEAVDDTGVRRGPVALSVDAGATVHFNSGDLEDGNAEKGLPEGVGPGEGDWRLVLDSDLDFEVLAYVRTQDGFLTSMHDLAPRRDGRYRVAIFNPGSNPNQVSRLRLVNPGSEAAEVTITGVDDAGASPGTSVEFEIPAGESLTLTASDLEAGVGVAGALGDGVGKWRLRVTATGPLVAMSLLSSPTGHLTNLSTVPRTPDDEHGVHVAPLFPSASDPRGRQGFVRVVNRAEASGTVSIEAFDDSDLSYPPVTLALDAKQTRHFNSDDLELGNAEKGLAGSTGAGVGDWRLVLSSDLDIEVLAYIRAADGFLTSMHEVAPVLLGERRVAIFNPGSNPNQVSRLRLVNPGAEDAQVTITGIDDAGASPGAPVTVTVPAGASRSLAAADLEAGADGFAGALGDGVGKWRLRVESDQPIVVMSLLSSPTGHLTNLSSAPDRGGN